MADLLLLTLIAWNGVLGFILLLLLKWTSITSLISHRTVQIPNENMEGVSMGRR
jgi:hypothetical protein